MINNKALRQLAVAGVSLPTFAVSPAVAKATVYMPSQVAARMLGGRPAKHVAEVAVERTVTQDADRSNAA